jgi:3-phosphoglycerate kinase
MALDIGPATCSLYRDIIESSRTAIWCGTVGFHKSETFSAGTRALCDAFARTSAFTLVAGDDSVAAARAIGPSALAKIDCVARGGQATLALLNEHKLAGLEALRGTP